MTIALGTPPRHGPAHGAPGARTVMASTLVLRRWRDVVPFFVAALRLRRLVGRVASADTLWLRASPWRRTFWTLSTWSSPSGAREYHVLPEHLAVARRFGPRLADSRFVTWEVDEPPHRSEWDGVTQRLAAVPPRDQSGSFSTASFAASAA